AVWDACAGGGGKTLQLASQLKNRGVLYASDIRGYKLDELRLRVRRAGFHNVRRFIFDAETVPPLPREIEKSGGFHRILVDAPCSGSGTLRRNPDVRFRIMPDDLPRYAALQLKLLEAVHPFLRRDGKLVYATCSIFRAENEDVITRFTTTHPQFVVEETRWVGSPDLDADTMFYAILAHK
ncbi:MAG: RsmB/NOP family class I SAM-dependent RNA methyltransferase, partial [Leptospiraceae bacterium]|nr:RsmB/NOP family class I SAM-dependent RNA methyltransferase [Leptospiraceae bacterium]